MENEENVLEQDSNVQEEEVLETSNDGGNDEQDSTDWKAKADKAEELANNYKIRAEKAEKLAKTVKSGETPKPSPTAGDITTKDLYALMEAKVPEEDIDEVARYAKFQGISIVEALKSNVVKTILSDKNEQRVTASAANISSSKRSSGKTPDDVLLQKASKGELPENDADLERLIKLRKGIK